MRYERARIASELHDIVAHAISVMVVQASAGQRIAARDPERVGEAFDAIAGAARQAEEDMGRLVDPAGRRATRSGPRPTSRSSRSSSRARWEAAWRSPCASRVSAKGCPRRSPQVAYRVVQEGLTNALRYASGAAVSVLVRGQADAVRVEVRNGPATGDSELAGVGTGNGLRGLLERVTACGGTLDAGPTADGGWLLGAWLSRRVAAPQPAG